MLGCPRREGRAAHSEILAGVEGATDPSHPSAVWPDTPIPDYGTTPNIGYYNYNYGIYQAGAAPNRTMVTDQNRCFWATNELTGLGFNLEGVRVYLAENNNGNGSHDGQRFSEMLGVPANRLGFWQCASPNYDLDYSSCVDPLYGMQIDANGDGITDVTGDVSTTVQGTISLAANGGSATVVAKTEVGTGDTRAGSNISVGPITPMNTATGLPSSFELSLCFTSVSGCGETTVNFTPGAAGGGACQAPADDVYANLIGGCFNIQTSAVYSGPVYVRIKYPPGVVPNESLGAEGGLKLYHVSSGATPISPAGATHATPPPPICTAPTIGVYRDGDGVAGNNGIDGGYINGILSGCAPSCFSPFFVGMDRYELLRADMTACDFAPPMGKKHRVGSTLPVKLCFSHKGTAVASQAQLEAILAEAGLPASCPEIRVYDVTDPGTPDLVEAIEANVGDPDNPGACFREGAGWIFNLRLDSASFLANRTYKVEVAIGGCVLEPGNGTFQTR